ncbi:LPXTG cell wall anchor domain-containing protein [Streptomyces sp. NPDC001443]
MKIRRALATAAATAVIAPLALLSAPVAFADDEPATPPTSASAPADGQPSDTDPDTTSTATATTTETTTETSGTGAENGAGTGTGTGSEAGTGTEPGTGTDKTPDSGSTTDTKGSTPSGGSTESAEPTAEPDACPVDEDGVDADSQLTLGVSGLPGKIVAGSGWHKFKLVAANHSDKPLGTVQWLAFIDNESMSDDESDWLSDYAKIEYYDPQTKVWESIADEIGDGMYFGETDLGPKQTVDIKLRVNITAKAPAGDSFTLGMGGYLDSEKNCVHTAFSVYEFSVLKPGSSNENPGQAKPGKDTKPPAGGKQPQGGAAEIPATGTLASTGSSSALPTIGLVGGVAVVAGAGALFMVRRRKADAQA